MHIEVGGTYKISGCTEWAYFHVLDVYEYKGHYGVYGVSNTRQIHVPHNTGYQDVPDRPVAFPVLVTADVASRDRFYDQLFMERPAHIEMLQGVRAPSSKVRIPNPQSLRGWHYYGESTRTIDTTKLKMLPVQLIDLWEHWQRYGIMPTGYEDAKLAARQGVN